MSDDNSALTVTLKAGNGYDAPWVVVRGDNPDQVVQRLESIGAAVGAAAVNAARSLQSVWNVVEGLGATVETVETVAAPPANAWAAQTSTAALPQQAPAGAPGPVCQHGPMVARSGTSKASGKPWSGWFCPTPKGTPGQCEPQFNR